MKINLFIILLVFSSNVIYSQCNGRYVTQIFNSVSKTTVNYSDQIQYQDSYHEMDIYTPDGDTASNRPLIIFIHGGTYLGGNKTVAIILFLIITFHNTSSRVLYK